MAVETGLKVPKSQGLRDGSENQSGGLSGFGTTSIRQKISQGRPDPGLCSNIGGRTEIRFTAPSGLSRDSPFFRDPDGTGDGAIVLLRLIWQKLRSWAQLPVNYQDLCSHPWLSRSVSASLAGNVTGSTHVPSLSQTRSLQRWSKRFTSALALEPSH
jgi:hypothetical protein